VETIGSKRSYALTWCMPNNNDDDDDDDDLKLAKRKKNYKSHRKGKPEQKNECMDIRELISNAKVSLKEER